MGIEELCRQIAVARHHFDALSPGFGHPSRCCSIAFHDVVDHLDRELTRDKTEALGGRARGGVARLDQPITPPWQFAAGMKELHESARALGTNSVEQPAEMRDAVI